MDSKDFCTLASIIDREYLWLLIPHILDDVAFLDIETTGLDRIGDDITTIAVFYRNKFYNFVNGENFKEFPAFISQIPVIVTYYGSVFDLPFLRNAFNMDFLQLHLDLCFLCRKFGLKGGLKNIERKVGLRREEVEDIDGFVAITLWYRYQSEKDRAYLETLLAYNNWDVFNLAFLLPHAYNELLKYFSFTGNTLSLPQIENTSPFKAHPKVVEELRRVTHIDTSCGTNLSEQDQIIAKLSKDLTENQGIFHHISGFKIFEQEEQARLFYEKCIDEDKNAIMQFNDISNQYLVVVYRKIHIIRKQPTKLRRQLLKGEILMDYIPFPKDASEFNPWDHYQPSKIDFFPWLFASDITNHSTQAFISPGKWLLFVPRNTMDTTWQIIKSATLLGKLGPESKVSTNYNNQFATNKNMSVICVYTCDSENETDVKRVRTKLRELGFIEKIPYKTDQATLEGKYSKNGDTQISKYFE